MSIVKQRIWSGAVTANTTGVGSAGSVTASRSARNPLAATGRVVGAELNVTAASGTTPTLDVKLQGDGGGSPAVWKDHVTFTQKTTTGTETKGLDSGWTDIVNPSGANPLAVDVLQNLRLNFTTGGTTPSFTCTVDLLISIDD